MIDTDIDIDKNWILHIKATIETTKKEKKND